MTKYVITLYSKDEKSLKLFSQFFHYSLKIRKLQMPLYYKKKKNKKQKIAVLKSPHVNKTAQDHFELRTYSLSIVVNSYKTQKYVLFLKKIKNQLFPEIKIKIKGYIFIKNSIKNKFLNPNNFTFQVSKFNLIKQTLNFKKLKDFKMIHKNYNKKKVIKNIVVYKLKILDYYGKSFKNIIIYF